MTQNFIIHEITSSVSRTPSISGPVDKLVRSYCIIVASSQSKRGSCGGYKTNLPATCAIIRSHSRVTVVVILQIPFKGKFYIVYARAVVSSILILIRPLWVCRQCFCVSRNQSGVKVICYKLPSLIGGCSRISLVVALVLSQSTLNCPQIALSSRVASFCSCAINGDQDHCSQNADDGNDHKKLDQGKTF